MIGQQYSNRCLDEIESVSTRKISEGLKFILERNPFSNEDYISHLVNFYVTNKIFKYNNKKDICTDRLGNIIINKKYHIKLTYKHCISGKKRLYNEKPLLIIFRVVSISANVVVDRIKFFPETINDIAHKLMTIISKYENS